MTKNLILEPLLFTGKDMKKGCKKNHRKRRKQIQKTSIKTNKFK